MSELVNTNCPHCGAGIQVNPEFKNQLFCKYCGSSFMVRDVIHMTVNNYNDMSQSTYSGIVGKRQVYIEELKREIAYFQPKANLYNEINSLQAKFPAIEKMRELDKSGAHWIKVIGNIFTYGGMASATICLLAGFSYSHFMIGALISFVFGLLGIGIQVAYYKLLDHYEKKYKDSIDTQNAAIKRITDELIPYYNAYGNCFVGFDYSFPDKLTKIYDLIQSGRAESVKDAIQIMETP